MFNLDALTEYSVLFYTPSKWTRPCKAIHQLYTHTHLTQNKIEKKPEYSNEKSIELPPAINTFDVGKQKGNLK